MSRSFCRRGPAPSSTPNYMSVVYLGFPVGAKTGFMLAGPPKEVVMTVGTAPCNVFDADLPTLSYSPDETPAEVYPRFQAAQQQAPVAIGPLGPEVLSYHLVRSVLRDNRFQIPPGIVLQAQGVTSGPLWDKVINSLLRVEGETHRRLRGLCSRAFTPRTVEIGR